MKIRIRADWDHAQMSTGDGFFDIDTDYPVDIEIKTPGALNESVPMDHQLVLRQGWIECAWDKLTGFITALRIVPGDPFKKDDLQLMDWIQERDPRKEIPS